MTYLLLIGIPLALLVLFLALVTFEERSNRRILAGRRMALDLKVERASFVLRHVDWGAFLNDLLHTAFERALHDIAHGSLIAVRALERELTGVVRTLRSRREQPTLAPRDAAKPTRVEAAVSYVRKTVRRSRKQPRLPEERS